jgi:hypothetical protein
LIAERVRPDRQRPEGSDNLYWLFHGVVRIEWWPA